MSIIVKNQYPAITPPDGQLKLAFVGEAPADEEVRLGKPFVGPSGYELDIWMKSANILRPQCFIGNLSQEQAPGNKLERMFVDTKCTTPGARLSGHIEILKQQLTDLRPNCIVALGAHPLYILTGKTGIFKQWGSILPCTLVPGLKVIPVPHPSAIIRGLWAMRQIISVFLRRAAAESQTKGLNLPEHNLVLDPDPDTILHHLNRLLSSEAVAFDIENPGRSPIVCISFSDSPDWVISIPFNRGLGHRWHRYVEQEIWVAISKLLSNDALKIAHNLNYDFTYLTTHKIHVKPPYYDTMQAHHVCYPDLSRDELKKYKLNSLALCTALYTTMPYYKSDFKVDNSADPKWKGAEYEFWRYNANDSLAAFKIYLATKHDLTQMGQLPAFEHDMSVWKPLMAMSLKGVAVDKERKAEVTTLCDKYIQQTNLQINTIVGREVDTASHVDVKRVLYTDLDLPMQFDRGTGKPSSDAVALHRLVKRTGHPVPNLIIDIRRFAKLKSSYLDTMLSSDERFHTTYNQARTTTFRLSSSEFVLGGGGNLQQIPGRKRGNEKYDDLVAAYKKTFKADPGKILGMRDLKQAEAVIVAYLARDRKQIEDFKSGIDTHSVAASFLFEADYKTIYEGNKNGDPKYKTWRFFGKKIRHAVNYKTGKNRMSDEFIKEGYDITPKECQRMLSAMLAGIPMVVNWQNEIEHEVRDKRFLTTPLGRRRYAMGKITDEVIRSMIAFVPQCSVAHILDIGLDNIYNWIEQQDDPDEFDLLVNVHDAVMFQTVEDKIQEHSKIVGDLMKVPVIIHGEEVIIDSDLKIGSSWGELGDFDWEEEDEDSL